MEVYKMGEDKKRDVTMLVKVDHHEYPHIASSFAIKDMEYIRKRVNAFRNSRNKELGHREGRTYESMKTLIDIIEVVTESGAGIYEVVPIKTTATVQESKYAEIIATGKFAFNGDSTLADSVEYKIRATFIIYPSGKEVYTVQYDLLWDEGVSPSGTDGSITWTDVYPVEGDGLGYSENLPAPSAIAGKVAENIMVTVMETWRNEEEEAGSEQGDEEGGSEEEVQA